MLELAKRGGIDVGHVPLARMVASASSRAGWERSRPTWRSRDRGKARPPRRRTMARNSVSTSAAWRAASRRHRSPRCPTTARRSLSAVATAVPTKVSPARSTKSQSTTTRSARRRSTATTRSGSACRRRHASVWCRVARCHHSTIGTVHTGRAELQPAKGIRIASPAEDEVRRKLRSTFADSSDLDIPWSWTWAPVGSAPRAPHNVNLRQVSRNGHPWSPSRHFLVRFGRIPAKGFQCPSAP